MKIIVQKFGGTSVASEHGWECLAQKVKAAIEQGLSPVLVVSAMGRYPDPYATDTLLSLVRRFAESVCTREKDMLMACGELISAAVVSHYLRSVGLPAQAFSGAKAGIHTDASFGEARITSVDPRLLLQALERGSVPVVAGFQGDTEESDVATLGRGGSDTTAVALGAALQAECVEIYTDVDGVMTADPRQVANAKVLPEIASIEVGEMAHEGAKVLHPRAVDMAQSHQVPLVVRSTFSQAPGTSIVSQAIGCPSVTTIIDSSAANQRVATGIVTVADYCAVSVDLSLETNPAVVRLNILEGLAKAKVSLDMIDVVPNRLYFLIKTSQLDVTKDLLIQSRHGFSVRMRCAKVSVVGQGMRGTPGVMLRICRALERAKAELIYSTDSHITISCVVTEDQMKLAAEALHQEFGLDS